MNLNTKKNKLILGSLFSILLVFSIIIPSSMMYLQGHKDGYLGALQDVQSVAGIDYTWKDNGDGTYTVNIWRQGVNVESMAVKVDTNVLLTRLGQIIESDRHAGVLTTIGKDFIEQQISGTASTTDAIYISCDDTDASGLSAASTKLTSETDDNGITRATGTYASTGAGTWTVTKAFSITGTQAVQTYGLQWSATKQSDNNLLCYDTSAVKNCVDGDTLTITWSLSDS